MAGCYSLQSLDAALGPVCPHYWPLELSLLSQSLLWPSSLTSGGPPQVKSEGSPECMFSMTEVRQEHTELANTCSMPGSPRQAYLPEACPGAQDPAELGEELWVSTATILVSISWLL